MDAIQDDGLAAPTSARLPLIQLLKQRVRTRFNVFQQTSNKRRTGAKLRRCAGQGPNSFNRAICKAVP